MSMIELNICIDSNDTNTKFHIFINIMALLYIIYIAGKSQLRAVMSCTP